MKQPPSGGCVLKRDKNGEMIQGDKNAATFGWLCVETTKGREYVNKIVGSHLRVAVC